MTALPAEVREPFDGADDAQMATITREGVPTRIGVEGKRIAFPSSPTSVTAGALCRDRQVSIPVTDQANRNGGILS